VVVERIGPFGPGAVHVTAEGPVGLGHPLATFTETSQYDVTVRRSAPSAKSETRRRGVAIATPRHPSPQKETTRLKRRDAAIQIANADRLIHLGQKDLAIANLARSSALHDRVNGGFDDFVVDNHF